MAGIEQGTLEKGRWGQLRVLFWGTFQTLHSLSALPLASARRVPGRVTEPLCA